MDFFKTLLAGPWPPWTAALCALAGTLLVGLVAERLVLAGLARWRQREGRELDPCLHRLLQRTLLLWVVLLAVYLAAQAAPLTPRALELAGRVVTIAWVLSLTWSGARLGAEVVRWYSRAAGGEKAVTSLFQQIARLTILALGGLVLLSLLGISITPMLTALGVGSLAVALALQDTLSNAFAGFYISLARQVRVGDYIKLDTGQEGYVSDITWRSTTLRTLANNLIVVPNAKLGQAVVTNYHLPQTRMSLLIPVSVAYGTDPDTVERVLLDVARRGAGEIPGLLAEPEPMVRFIPGFGESSLDFTLSCHVAEFVDQFRVQHELRKRILRRFAETGISIPFPTRTIHMRREKTGAGPSSSDSEPGES